jgi:hypothetical protein
MILLSLFGNLIDATKKIILTLLIICSLEKLTLPSNNVPVKTPLELEICLVLLLLLPLEDSSLFKMLKKFMALLISSKEEISLDNPQEFPLLNTLVLLTYSIISLNSLYPSMMVLLTEEMS